MGITVLLMAITAAPISIALTSPKIGYISGENVPFVAMAINKTNKPIDLVPQGDGMFWGGKSPYAGLESYNVDTKSWTGLHLDLRRCGNTESTKIPNFVTVAPNGSVDLLNGMAWCKYEVNEVLKEPGTYRIRFRYVTTRQFYEWLGWPMGMDEADKIIDNLRLHFERVPKGEFVSNEITIKITQSPR